MKSAAWVDRYYLSLVLLHINLVSQYYEWEVLGITRAGLNQEFVSPAVQGLKRLGAIDIVYEDTAVGTSVESDSQGLESFLSGSVPQLFTESVMEPNGIMANYDVLAWSLGGHLP